MNTTSYDVTVQLSHLLAFEIGFSGIEATIIDTLYGAEKEITYDNIKKEIKDQFKTDIDSVKINKSIENLKLQNKIYCNGSTIRLSPDISKEVYSMVNCNQQIEDNALNEWINSFQSTIEYELSQKDFDTLKTVLLKHIKNFFLKHGADSFSILTGDFTSDNFDIRILVEESVNEVPSYYKEKFRVFLLTIFSQLISSNQRNYCYCLINKAISYLSTVVNDDIKKIIIEQLNDITIYLDTPILYRLLNLQGQDRFETVKSLVENCNNNNIKLKILQTTFDELKRRVSFDASVIYKNPTPRSFSEIGYKCRTSDNYISTFWAVNKETGISVTDFNFLYSDLKSLIEEHHIEIDTRDYIVELNLESNVTDMYKKVSEFSSNDPEYIKSLNSIDHDSKCLAIVEKLRLPNASSAINGKTVFLSSDWSLLKLQRYDHEYKDKVDFVLLPSQIMQLFCITQSTESFYEAFLGMFSSSKTYFGTKSLSNSNIQEILGRIAIYKGATPLFAQKVLSNELIQNSFIEKEKEQERLQVVDDAILIEVEQMEKDLTIKSDQISEIKEDNLNKEGKIQNLSNRLSILEEARQKDAEVIDNKNNEIENISKYESHYKKSSTTRSIIKASIVCLFGLSLVLLGGLCLMIGIFAIIPFSSPIVEPCFSWMHHSLIIKSDPLNNLSILQILFVISFAFIPAGTFILKLGYSERKKKYYNKFIDKIKN